MAARSTEEKGGRKKERRIRDRGEKDVPGDGESVAPGSKYRFAQRAAPLVFFDESKTGTERAGSWRSQIARGEGGE
eukprot:5561222-Pleurochrysis_carterae.AAC.2